MYAMRSRQARRRLGVLAALALFALCAAVPAAARNHGHGNRSNAFTQRNLVSDVPGRAPVTDPNLVNAWGLAAGPSTPLWVADNGKDVSTLYSGAVNGSPVTINPLVVSIPGGAPTGIVFNPTSDFQLHPGDPSTAARFVFDSEAGRITAWSPNVAPTTTAQTKVTTPDAVYKGLAFASTRQGSRLYAADFHGAKIDVFDGTFAPVTLPPGRFTDSRLPAGYAPFNVQELGGRIYVTYAKQDAMAHDDVPGIGKGFVDVYNTRGQLRRRLIKRGQLNAPWGLAIAPRGFGKLGGDLLVGNFGDGFIHAYDARSGRLRATLSDRRGTPIQIDGLWALRFGNGTFGTPSTLVFSAGPDREQHGLLGQITATKRSGHH